MEVTAKCGDSAVSSFREMIMYGIGYYYTRDILGNGTLASIIVMAGLIPGRNGKDFPEDEGREKIFIKDTRKPG